MEAGEPVLVHHEIAALGRQRVDGGRPPVAFHEDAPASRGGRIAIDRPPAAGASLGEEGCGQFRRSARTPQLTKITGSPAARTAAASLQARHDGQKRCRIDTEAGKPAVRMQEVVLHVHDDEAVRARSTSASCGVAGTATGRGAGTGRAKLSVERPAGTEPAEVMGRGSRLAGGALPNPLRLRTWSDAIYCRIFHAL